VIPAIVRAGSRSDAVLCECGEEIVQLYTFDLTPGATYYAIDGQLFAVDYSCAESMPVTRAEPIEGGAGAFSLVTTCRPMRGSFEFTATAACETCISKRVLFRVSGGALTARE